MRRCAHIDQRLYASKDSAAHRSEVIVRFVVPRILIAGIRRPHRQAPKVNWVDLLTSALGDVPVLIKEIVLISEFFTSQQQRYSYRRHQAHERQLDPLLNLFVRESAQHREQTLMAIALDIVLRHIVDGLRAVREYTAKTTVDRFAHRPLEIVTVRTLTKDCGSDACLKILIP